MTIRLSLEEQETHLNMTADNRGTWFVYSDDAVMIRKLEAIGARLVKEENHGGRHYELRADQVLLRRGKPERSEAQRAASAEKMRRLHAQRAGSAAG